MPSIRSFNFKKHKKNAHAQTAKIMEKLEPGQVLVHQDGTRYLIGKQGNLINTSKAMRKDLKKEKKGTN